MAQFDGLVVLIGWLIHSHLLDLVVLEDIPTGECSFLAALFFDNGRYSVPPIGRLLHPRPLGIVFIDEIKRIGLQTNPC